MAKPGTADPAAEVQAPYPQKADAAKPAQRSVLPCTQNFVVAGRCRNFAVTAQAFLATYWRAQW